ncbi:RING finger protein nhl-1 [Orchesella cincta]|uniref:RING finger protein nhl-1 n=1 Tax=Orchesella cincta TaxID=48709 RepID=A0A1D2NLX0_ORCCI|nr:RING finger protein nhl-1 [Orchesella cincta]
MDQFEQLLTCAICLDRYRNPKLLPCQHSFCMEPCMEGLVDYVRRQVKCPECRAEHRVGYQGVQAFPTNVTLQRFLELHVDLTGELPDPTSNQIMERCQICSEKQYCSPCAHCDKKVCPDCKEAHIDVLKREIQRIGNQVRRVLHRLNDALSAVEKNTMQLQTNSISVMDEIDDIYRRLSKALKDRTENLKIEVERYLGNELKQLSTLRTNLEQEVANIQSNIDLVEKYMITENGTTVTWQDNELMDTKDIFLKTMEFIRNFEYEPGDYGRRIKFNTNHDVNSLASTLNTFGDLHLPTSSTQNVLGGGSSSNNSLAPPHINQGQGSALMRSKSDHRLTMQFRGQPDEDDPPSFGSGGRKFGDQRPARTYGQDDDSCGGERKSRFRSRFTRHLDSSFDEPEPQPNRVRFETQTQQPPVKERERVLDTEDASKGPLSGVTRLADSSRVIQRIAESERPPKPAPAPVVPPQVVAPPKVTAPAVAPWRNRQMSEEDEISKQKKQNKEQEKATTTAVTRRQTSNEPRSPGYTTATAVVDDHASEVSETAASRVRKVSPDRFTQKKRAESEDSGSTSESASSSGSSPVGTGAIFSTEEVKNRFLSKTDGPATTATPHRKDSTSSVASSTTGNGGSSTNSRTTRSYQNRYQTNKGTEKPVEPAKEEEEESESESESSESESEEESDSPPPTPPKKTTAPEPKSRMEKTDIGPLLARSANARDTPSSTASTTSSSGPGSLYSARKRAEAAEPQSPTQTSTASPFSAYRSRSRISSPTTREPDPEPTTTRGRYGGTTSTSSSSAGIGSSRYPSSYSAADYTPNTTGLSRSRTGTSLYSTPADDTPSSRFSSGLASKYLNRSRHNFDVDDHPTPSSRYGSSTTTPSVSSSSGPMTRRSYLSKQRNGTTSAANNLEADSKSSRLSNIRDRRARINRSKSSHDVLAGIDFTKDEEDEEPESPKITYKYQRRKSTAIAGGDPDYKTPSAEDSTSLSSWARYLKNKYGKDKAPTLPAGSDPALFTWPRGIASGPDGSIVVADSSNHRIQVFDQHGSFVKEFGQYGNGEGEFDCLAGVAVNRIGQFIISDRYNHRIQVFDPSGRFLRAFGSQGSSDGRFNYPWGLCTDALGFIYVCDKENHRIQVFQSDGTFVGKFGTIGSKIGELEHPHYIAVTSTNKVVVSDTNNHRIQIFDVNGKVLSSFGTEGSEEGQFKLPRGLAVTDEGNIVVGDSGNNRIQIFNPDGTFLHSFGAWGSGDGEFKGMEGVAVTPNGNILVCDRENHRIQAF